MRFGTNRRALDATSVDPTQRHRECPDIAALLVAVVAIERKGQDRELGPDVREIAGFYLL